MWCSDYSYSESTVGYYQQAIWDMFDATETVEQAQAIVGGTAMKLSGACSERKKKKLKVARRGWVSSSRVQEMTSRERSSAIRSTS